MKSFFIATAAAIVASVCSLTLVGQAQPAKTPSAVAFVSATRVLNESARGREEAARVQTMQQQRTADMRSKQQALEAVRQQLAAATDPAIRQELAQKENQQRAEFERASVQFQNDLQALQREVNADLQRRVKAVLDDLMKTQSYQLVLNSETSVMWGAPDLDLTAAVVSRMNAQ